MVIYSTEHYYYSVNLVRVSECEYVCVCVRERERERERDSVDITHGKS